MAATLSIECDKTVLVTSKTRTIAPCTVPHTAKVAEMPTKISLTPTVLRSIDMFFHLLAMCVCVCVCISQNLIHKAKAKATEEKRHEHYTGEKAKKKKKKPINSKCMAYARSHRSLGSTFSFALEMSATQTTKCNTSI